MKKSGLFGFKKIADLETLEEKSFWLVTVVMITLGLVSLLTAGSYENAVPALIAIVLCLVIPTVLIIVVVKTKNYHSAYPILCIAIGAISIPLMFIAGGGFFSGMPMFCVVLTGLTALCFLPKWRYVSFFLCLIGTTLAFLFVYISGAGYCYNPIIPGVRFPIVGTDDLYKNMKAVFAVYNDMFFTYYCASAGLFSIINFTTSDVRRYKFNQDAFQQFFDKEKRKEILNNALKSDLSKTSNHKNAAILFADISNFTSVTEKMTSGLIMEYLNEFFTTLSTHIHDTGGIIDKFIGDCVMAYWIDQEGENCVLNAVQAMIETRKDIVDKMETIYNKYGTELNFSVGISYGDVIFGDIGSNTMHDYTIIGDAVNTASRIESIAVSGEMLVSDAALQKIKDSVDFENIKSNYFLKGKNKPIDLYRIIGLSDKKHDSDVASVVDNGYILHVCGCRGSFPVSGLRFSEYGGETSCYVVRKEDYAVIIDCGTGLKNAVKIIEGCKKIDILLTHLHYDHILGLLMTKFPEDAEIRVFGQFGVWDKYNDPFASFMEHPYWPVGIINMEKVDIQTEKDITLSKGIKATFYLSDHPDNTCVIKLMCGDKRVVFFADCENANSLKPEISENCDLLFFDGMYDDSEIENHRGWGHGTWQGGVNFAQEKNIKKLVITHHNPEMGDHSLKEREVIAREKCQNVSFAKAGDMFIL